MTISLDERFLSTKYHARIPDRPQTRYGGLRSIRSPLAASFDSFKMTAVHFRGSFGLPGKNSVTDLSSQEKLYLRLFILFRNQARPGYGASQPGRPRE